MKKLHVPALLLILIPAFFCLVPGCTDTTAAERTVVDGTGIFYLPDKFGSPVKIVGDDGLVYLPSQFPYYQFENGDRVAFSGHPAPSPYYPIQSGIPIELVLMRQIPGNSGYIYGIGNVTLIPVEGGFYGITVDTGAPAGVYKYLPLDLDSEFSVDGMEVSFTAKGRPEATTTAQWGLPVNIVRMKQLLPQE